MQRLWREMERFKTSEGLTPLASGYLWMCAAVFAVLRISGGAVNIVFYASVAQDFGAAREIATLLGAAMYLAYALIARRRPRALNALVITVFTVALFLAFGVLIVVAVRFDLLIAFVAALFLRTMASASLVVLFAFCLLRLESFAQVAAVIAFGYLGNYLLTPLVYAVPSPVLTAVWIAAAGIACAAFCGHFAQDGIGRVSSAQPVDDLELADPWAFLKPTHALFVCVFLFHTATGFAITFNEVGNAPVQIGAEGFAIVLVALYLVFVKGDRQEDTLFSFAALLVSAGLLVAPLAIATGQTTATPNTLIRFGGDCFTVLLWLVIAGVGRRNLFGMLPVLGFALACGSVGTTVGAVSGHAANAFVLGDPVDAMAVCLSLAFGFFAFLWVGFRSFSFSDTINGVRELSQVAANAQVEQVLESDEPQADVIAQRCATLAEEHGLTPRETEIFEMLARGRNGRFIMDHFVISRNTAKSHIKHVYSKLDVHSQQDLIDLVQ